MARREGCVVDYYISMRMVSIILKNKPNIRRMFVKAQKSLTCKILVLVFV